jgi:hypothetical protein
MRTALLVLLAGCNLYQNNEPPPPSWPDAALTHDAPYAFPDAPDAGPIIADALPDAYVPDAPPDAPPPPPALLGTPVTIAAGQLVWSAHLADLDGDGHSDLVYLTHDHVVIRRGLASGGFAAPVDGPATTSWWVAAGDIDGDGILDLAATGRELVTVWFGNGDGTFGVPHSTSLYDGPIGITTADVDGYPGDELVITTGQYFYVFTWFVDEVHQIYLVSSGPNASMATRDFDADGLADTIIGAYSYMYPMHGSVDGARPTTSIGGDSTVAGTALANVDGDPRVDAIAALPAIDKIGIYSAVQDAPDHTTTHQYASELWPVTTGTPRFVAAGDLNNDGIAEVIAGMPDTMRIQPFTRGTAGAVVDLAEPMSSVVFEGGLVVVTLDDQIVIIPPN